MADEKKYIAYEAVLNLIENGYKFGYSRHEVDEILRKLPAADVRPVVRGRWESVGINAGERCSVCGARFIGDAPLDWEFCPWCGADMREAAP